MSGAGPPPPARRPSTDGEASYRVVNAADPTRRSRSAQLSTPIVSIVADPLDGSTAPAPTPGGGAGESSSLPGEVEALDAYSRTVTAVVERLAPSVASLRVLR